MSNPHKNTPYKNTTFKNTAFKTRPFISLSTFLLFLILIATSVLMFATRFKQAATIHHNAPIERRHYGDWEKEVGYTQVVRVGKTLHLAGLGGEGETQAEQIENAYQQIQKILKDYDANLDDIVKEVIYTTDIEELIAATVRRKKYFPEHKFPASSWVEVSRLYSPDMKVEIEVTVQIP
jgi:2-iminobutanoate/2-iminopropanoate deaminase